MPIPLIESFVFGFTGDEFLVAWDLNVFLSPGAAADAAAGAQMGSNFRTV